MKKKLKVVWDLEAKESLKSIYEYIKEESPQGAKKVKNTILTSTRILAQNPLMYEKDRFRNNDDDSYRAYEVYSYRITYKVTEEMIYILRLRHTSQSPIEY